MGVGLLGKGTMAMGSIECAYVTIAPAWLVAHGRLRTRTAGETGAWF